MRVLLDKNALHGLSTVRLIEIAESSELCLPEVLFYELLTTHDRDERAMLFRKLAALRGKLRFTGSLGHLLRIEDERGSPAIPVTDAECDVPEIFFLTTLAEPTAALPAEIAQTLTAWRAHVSREVGVFRQQAGTMRDIFPELRGLRRGERPDLIAALRRRLGGDSEIVREIVHEVSTDEQRRFGTGPDWMGYRMMQARLIWVLQNFHAYGDEVGLEQTIDFENTVCDIEYATLASRLNFFLTGDRPQMALFDAMLTGIPVAPDLPRDNPNAV